MRRRSTTLDRPDVFGDTPLHLAAKQGSIVAVRSLLAAGADPTIRNNNGYTAEQVCADVECVLELRAAAPEPEGHSFSWAPATTPSLRERASQIASDFIDLTRDVFEDIRDQALTACCCRRRGCTRTTTTATTAATVRHTATARRSASPSG